VVFRIRIAAVRGLSLKMVNEFTKGGGDVKVKMTSMGVCG
jgi:hypothetical protein